MQIISVNDKQSKKEFYSLPKSIYANDKNWIQPLDKDVLEVFDPQKNKAFRFGTVERWILRDDKKCIGRIAAFVNKKYKNKGDEFPVGGVGFFECINDQNAANLLLDTAKNWLQENGMQAMDGPINFGERDRWWGMVSEGFQEPLYCMNYNPPYYNDLFKNYGFQLFFEQHCLGMNPKEYLGDKIWQRHDLIAKNLDFSSSIIDKSNLKKFAADFATVYNKAWAGHGGLKQLSNEQVEIMFKKMKPVMDKYICYFIYYKKEPIGIFVNLPDLNQWFKYLHGKFGLLQKLKFLYVKATKKNKKFVGLVFGIVPEWQGKGVDAYLICEADKYVKSDKVPYTEYEMQWIGDFNPKMLNIADSLGKTHLSRKLITYRYNFDRNLEFKRHPILS